MYARELEGQTLTFGVSGKLIMNGLVMYDRETGSLWSQVIGQGVQGTFSGVGLTVIPGWQTTWERWLEEHPETLVMDKRGGYQRDPYAGYYLDSSNGILGQSIRDERLQSKELVVGVSVGDQSTAYPFSALRRPPVVNDELNGTPLLVTFDSDSATVVVFDPVVDGRRLEFRTATTSGEFLITDLETGSLWDPVTGVALRGELEGKLLSLVASHYEFWFAWKDYRPDTELYGADQEGS